LNRYTAKWNVSYYILQRHYIIITFKLSCNSTNLHDISAKRLKFTKLVINVLLAVHSGLCRIFHLCQTVPLFPFFAFSTPTFLCRSFHFSQFPLLHFWWRCFLSRNFLPCFLLCRCFMARIFSRSELKSVHWKCNLFAFFLYLLNICRQFEFLISQCSNLPKMRRVMLCFVANFTSFPCSAKMCVKVTKVGQGNPKLLLCIYQANMKSIYIYNEPTL